MAFQELMTPPRGPESSCGDGTADPSPASPAVVVATTDAASRFASSERIGKGSLEAMAFRNHEATTRQGAAANKE
jgi:hypothetical protein